LTREGYLWSLMPLVDEALLEHNLSNEAGLQRMWEDEQIEIKMRDMRISEGCILTHQKAEAFNHEYKTVTEPMIESKYTVKVSEKEVIT